MVDCVRIRHTRVEPTDPIVNRTNWVFTVESVDGRAGGPAPMGGRERERDRAE
jgi:hypothetical protein